MSNAETKTLPAYRIYSVANGEQKAIWAEIGAAFEHKDRNGLSLVFTARPLEGAQIVLRVPKPAGKTSSETFNAGGEGSQVLIEETAVH
jgi:hypothetical protein